MSEISMSRIMGHMTPYRQPRVDPPVVIAVAGPAGSGKTTLGRALATALAAYHRVLAAFAAAPGAGAVAFEGGMLDKPHIRQAERILAAARRR